MEAKEQAKTVTKINIIGLSAMGLLTAGLAVTTLAPTYGLNPDLTVTIPPCITRRVNATITGGGWQAATVCNADEYAMSVGGLCPSGGSMVGAVTSHNVIDRQAWLHCTTSGSAWWYAMCCDGSL